MIVCPPFARRLPADDTADSPSSLRHKTALNIIGSAELIATS
jgi:hypothetical protein